MNYIFLLCLGVCMVDAKPFVLNSLDFKNRGPIPKELSGQGANRAPQLAWQGAPAGTKSCALIMEDPDAPGKIWIHWVVYNIPGTHQGLPGPDLGKKERLPDGIVQGINTNNHVGYDGPMPPAGDAPHHYHFVLYALDAQLSLPPKATAAQVRDAIQGHVLAKAELVGTYQRQ